MISWARKINVWWGVELQDCEQIYVSKHAGWGSVSLFIWRENLEDYNMRETSPNIKLHAAVGGFKEMEYETKN